MLEAPWYSSCVAYHGWQTMCANPCARPSVAIRTLIALPPLPPPAGQTAPSGIASFGISSFNDVRAVVKDYCYTCHQGKAAAGQLDLTRFTTLESLLKERPRWERVLARLRAAEMPPRGTPAPPMEQRQNVIS